MKNEKVNEEEKENTKNRSILMSDMSDYLEDMSYAENIVLNKEFLSGISTLKPLKLSRKGNDFLYLTEKEVMKYMYGDYRPGMDVIALKITQVFTALQIPYRARGHASENANKVTCVRTRGERKGETYTKTEHDQIQVFRTGKKFKKSKNALHNPTVGMELRTQRWIEENGADIQDILEKIGMVFA